jgi:hypothetical protein
VQIDYQQGVGPGYVPGVCNIGPEEITRRRRSGIFGVAIAAIVAIGLLVVGASPWWRVLLFPALAGGIVSLEQARRHFCAGFGLAGLRNFGTRDQRETVTDAAALATDRRASLTMFAYCSAIAAVITLAFVLLPI